MRRREFIALLGGAAAAWPLAARGQQPAMPVVGYLYPGSLAPVARRLTEFRRGLAESGYVEGQNVLIDYRFAEGRYDRLPELAGDLVRRRVAVIVTPGSVPAARAAKAATSTIPIVLYAADDPAKLGLVASLGRPGGNATGVNTFQAELGAKRVGLLRELVPAAARFGLLINPDNETAESVTRDVAAAASAVGVALDVVKARDSREIEAAFAALARNRAQALLRSPDTFLNNRRVQIVTLAARHGLPALYTLRECVEAGGLMSYGTSLADAYRQVGVYAGRILKGASPADLPVVQATKFELVINLPTARALGLEVPPTLLARADEVIE